MDKEAAGIPGLSAGCLAVGASCVGVALPLGSAGLKCVVASYNDKWF